MQTAIDAFVWGAYHGILGISAFCGFLVVACIFTAICIGAIKLFKLCFGIGG